MHNGARGAETVSGPLHRLGQRLARLGRPAVAGPGECVRQGHEQQQEDHVGEHADGGHHDRQRHGEPTHDGGHQEQQLATDVESVIGRSRAQRLFDGEQLLGSDQPQDQVRQGDRHRRGDAELDDRLNAGGGVGEERADRRQRRQEQRGEQGGHSQRIRPLPGVAFHLHLPGPAAAVDEEVDPECDQRDRDYEDDERGLDLEPDQRVDAVVGHHHRPQADAGQHRRPIGAEQGSDDDEDEGNGEEDVGRRLGGLLLVDQARIDGNPDGGDVVLVAPQCRLHVAQPALGIQVAGLLESLDLLSGVESGDAVTQLGEERRRLPDHRVAATDLARVPGGQLGQAEAEAAGRSVVGQQRVQRQLDVGIVGRRQAAR